MKKGIETISISLIIALYLTSLFFYSLNQPLSLVPEDESARNPVCSIYESADLIFQTVKTESNVSLTEIFSEQGQKEKNELSHVVRKVSQSSIRQIVQQRKYFYQRVFSQETPVLLFPFHEFI